MNLKKHAPKLLAAVLAVLLLASMAACAKTDEQKYADAKKLLTEGKLEEAVTAFTEIENYMESSKYIMYIKAVQLAESGQYELALRSFESLGDFRDSSLMVTYYIARGYEDMQEYEKAEESYKSIATFRDSSQRLNEIADKAAEQRQERLAKAAAAKRAEWSTIGNIVKLGRYEQDNNTANGKEEIEWVVLRVDESNDRVLLISKYALDCKPYNEKTVDITWEKCTLRSWLNNDFKNAAFTAEELSKIPTVTVPAHKNPVYDTNPGNDTQDQIFLLSITEAEKYFRSDDTRKAVPTAYAKAQGAYTSDSYKTANGEVTCWWWLRSPGGSGSRAACALIDGDVGLAGDDVGRVNYGANYVHYCDTAVRPALWVNLAS